MNKRMSSEIAAKICRQPRACVYPRRETTQIEECSIGRIVASLSLNKLRGELDFCTER
jgi:hypothetical protein